MPANFQRFLPILLVVFVLLFVLPQIFKKHSSKSLTAKELSQETVATAANVDRLERAFRASHRGYTASVADLLAQDHKLGRILGDGVAIALDVSTDKQTYYAQVASTVISLSRARAGNTVLVKSCYVVKSSSGVECPTSPVSTTTTDSTTTSTTATTTTTG
jgi:hypothetical protein